MDQILPLELVRVTEDAAIAASKWVGCGDKNAADQAAVNAMRNRLNALDVSGTVVIGEGEKDEAPMLYIGEKLGKGKNELDIAVDPLECTTYCARGYGGSMTVIATAPRGALYATKTHYMEKIAVSPLIGNSVSLENSVTENIQVMSEKLNKPQNEITIALLNRPRNEKMIRELRALKCRLVLFEHGDVAHAIQTCLTNSGVDALMGIGGATEGVLAACAIKAYGGYIECKPYESNDQKIYSIDELAQGDDICFAATGVTHGSILKGVTYDSNYVYTSSIVTRVKSKTIRYINTQHENSTK